MNYATLTPQSLLRRTIEMQRRAARPAVTNSAKFDSGLAGVGFAMAPQAPGAGPSQKHVSSSDGLALRVSLGITNGPFAPAARAALKELVRRLG